MGGIPIFINLKLGMVNMASALPHETVGTICYHLEPLTTINNRQFQTGTSVGIGDAEYGIGFATVVP